MDDDFIGLLLSLRRHVRNVGFGNSRAWSFLPECVDILMWRTSGHVHHRPGITYIFPMPFRYITFFYSYDCCSSLMHVTCYIGYIYSIHNIMSLIGVCSSADICSSKIGNYIFCRYLSNLSYICEAITLYSAKFSYTTIFFH